MTENDASPLTGRKVALIFIGAFAVIIGVNLTLAFQAVATFPGLEVKNSYVASQAFEAERAAQEALGWDVSARIEHDVLILEIDRDGTPVRPEIASAVLGRATNVAEDQFPTFRFTGHHFEAPIAPTGSGNWNLRLVAAGPDGTPFRQRIVVKTP